MGKLVKELTINDFASLKAFEIEKYLSYLTYYTDENGNNYSNGSKSKARKLSSIRAMFKYFMKKEIISRDPTVSIEMPKIKEKEIIRLETDEISQMLNVTESGEGLTKHQASYHENTKIRDTAIVGLLLGTGIRVSELVGIDIKDIDFDNASFVVTRKGGNRVQLYFSDEVGGLLYDYHQLRSSKDFAPTAENAFFLSLQKTRISTRAVENIVKKYSQIATPLKKITPHKLRSTYGTELYRKTGDIYIVADVLGHKDVNTTKKHYAAISNDTRRKASGVVILRDTDENTDK